MVHSCLAAIFLIFFFQGGSELASREMVHRCLAAISGSALARGLRGSGRRFDGRAPLESRPLEGSVAVLPFVHGSSLVSLGHTQVLVIFLFFYLFYFKFFLGTLRCSRPLPLGPRI